MGRYVVEVKETLTRSIVIDDENVNSYEEAKDQVSKAYFDTAIVLHADNSNVTVEFSDKTDHVASILGRRFEHVEPWDKLKEQIKIAKEAINIVHKLQKKDNNSDEIEKLLESEKECKPLRGVTVTEYADWWED